MFCKIGLSSVVLVLFVSYGSGFPTMDMADMFMRHSQDFLRNGTECMAKVGATEADIALFMKKKIPNTKTGHCMLACLLEKIDMIKDGKFMHEALLNVAKMILGEEETLADLMGEVAESCSKKVTTTDSCDAVGLLAKCTEDHITRFRTEVKKQ